MKEQNSPERLVRAVGFWGLVAFCINAVIGSGVYLLPSESFKLLGPFSLWAPVLFAVPVFILVLCFAEAASHFNEPGGAYLYSRTAFGDFIGFETGWMNTIARVTSLAALSNGFVVSLARIVPWAGHGVPRALLITLTLLAFAAIHVLGIKFGARTIYFFTVGKLLPLLIFVVVALIAFRYNPVPPSFKLPGADTHWGDAFLLLLFAYAGFENLGIPAGEYKDPRRELPMALLVGTLAIAVVYSLAQLAAMSAVPDLSQTATPIADAAAAIMGPSGALLITVGAIISILGTNLGTMLEGSRMMYALSLGRRPYTAVARIHERFRTPYVAIALLTVVSIPTAIAGSFVKLALLSAVARLTTYLFTCAAVPRLRRLSPGFRAPGGLLIPILGTLISIGLFFTLKFGNIIAALVALAVGAILYFISVNIGGKPELIAVGTESNTD
ncbi:MAG: APC family permease [Acidobacteriota bacterium]